MSNFIERLLDAAKPYKGIKRLYISRTEIKTDPIESRDKRGWPAAWEIAERAGISWGAGNTGQHQIHLTEEEMDAALPPIFLKRREETSEAEFKYKEAEEKLKDAKEDLIELWLSSPQGQHLTGKVIDSQKQVESCYKAERAARPKWYDQGDFFEVDHGSN
jgi:hypothetical protein